MTLAERFAAVAPRVEHWSLRLVEERAEELAVVRGVLQPPRTFTDGGLMVTVTDRGGAGTAATSDWTDEGLRRAGEAALAWAHRASGRSVVDVSRLPRIAREGSYESRERIAWDSVSLAAKIDLLREQDARLRTDSRIIDRAASLSRSEVEVSLFGSEGTSIHQRFRYVLPMMRATAAAAGTSETRTFGGHARSRQGGFEVLEETGFFQAAEWLTAQALELLDAPHCPAGTMDVVLAADQMILQVHESIGHPLELDRILGDERNYAGRSFVTPDMFGTYRYGSELLNVTFDPTVAGEYAGFAFDDDGTPATREHLIRDGILLRPLGGATSQARSGLPGVACARASGWNRPPVDRMANVNLEPGASSLEEMIGAIERGVWMETNCSWSIDDSRNKFQFGCERGRRIENGELREVVRRPGYRGVTRTFWRNLAQVGDRRTVEVLGTPYCGKGEPNQAIRAGHAAPACHFRGVEVFGGVS